MSSTAPSSSTASAAPEQNAQEILAKGIAKAKELAAKLAKNPPPPSSTTATQQATKRQLDHDGADYRGGEDYGSRSHPYSSGASAYSSQSDAFNQYKRHAPGADYPGGSSVRSYGSLNTDEMMIPSSKVGMVIGRGGENLKSFVASSGARIQIDKDDQGTMRRVTLVGTREACEEAKRLINEKISDITGGPGRGGPAVGSYGPTEETERTVIPANKVGLVIGTQGATLKDLQYQSGARIQIDKDHQATNPMERQVTIYGTSEAIAKAKQLLNDLVSGGGNRGGGGHGRPAQATMIIHIPGDMVGLIIGRGGETIKNIQQMSGCNIKTDQNNGAPTRVITVTGPAECFSYVEELIQEKVQGAAEIVSGGPAESVSTAYGCGQQQGYGADSTYYQQPNLSAADYSAYYSQASAGSSAQAYADYYAQYYQQQQPQGETKSTEAEGGDKGKNESAAASNDASSVAESSTTSDATATAAYYQQYYAQQGMDPAAAADYQKYYEQYYAAYYNQQSAAGAAGDNDSKDDIEDK